MRPRVLVALTIHADVGEVAARQPFPHVERLSLVRLERVQAVSLGRFEVSRRISRARE